MACLCHRPLLTATPAISRRGALAAPPTRSSGESMQVSFNSAADPAGARLVARIVEQDKLPADLERALAEGAARGALHRQDRAGVRSISSSATARSCGWRWPGPGPNGDGRARRARARRRGAGGEVPDLGRDRRSRSTRAGLDAAERGRGADRPAPARVAPRRLPHHGSRTSRSPRSTKVAVFGAPEGARSGLAGRAGARRRRRVHPRAGHRAAQRDLPRKLRRALPRALQGHRRRSCRSSARPRCASSAWARCSASRRARRARRGCW